MWLSKEAVRRSCVEGDAKMGTVTIPGQSAAVQTMSEKRSLEVVAPGGYVWVPGAEQDVLTVHCDTGETVIAGASMGASPVTVSAGEVCVYSKGGAYIRLKNDGTIVISGKVDVSGELTVNGQAVMTGMQEE